MCAYIAYRACFIIHITYLSSLPSLPWILFKYLTWVGTREVGNSYTGVCVYRPARTRAAPKHSDFGLLASQKCPELCSLNGIPAADPDNLVRHFDMFTPGPEIPLRWRDPRAAPFGAEKIRIWK